MRLPNLAAITSLAFLGAACTASTVPERPPVREAEVSRIEIRKQDFFRFEAVAPVRIETQKPLHAQHAKWELTIDGKPAGSGEMPLDVAIPAGGGIVEIATESRYAEGEKLAAVLESEKPLSIVMRGTIHTSDGGEWTFRRAGQVRTPRVPKVEIWHVEAGAFPQEGEVSLVFHVRVENRNPFEIQLEQMEFDLAINGKRLIEQGSAGRKARVPPASVAQIEIPLTLDERNFPQVRNAIRRELALAYTLDGIVRLGVGRIPIALEGPISLGGD